MRGDEIRVSSRTVLPIYLPEKYPTTIFRKHIKAFLLAWRVKEGCSRLPALAEMLTRTMMIWLIFTFGEPDPAVNPFTVPTKRTMKP